MADLDPAIRDYYERGDEADRLAGGFPAGPLERARTRELLRRYLPDAPADVLDVGGGPGVHASWLAQAGYRVALVDPIPLHVEQADAAGVSASVGDARDLAAATGSQDVVLLLGPLYHLPDRDDRMRALAEARRVLRPGGLVVAAAIGRGAALVNLLVEDRLHEPDVLDVVARSIRTGAFDGPDAGLFTTAFVHRAADLAAEVRGAGFVDVRVLDVEGPGAFLADIAERWADPARREAVLTAARLVEDDPEVLGGGAHLLAFAGVPHAPPAGSALTTVGGEVRAPEVQRGARRRGR